MSTAVQISTQFASSCDTFSHSDQTTDNMCKRARRAQQSSTAMRGPYTLRRANQLMRIDINYAHPGRLPSITKKPSSSSLPASHPARTSPAREMSLHHSLPAYIQIGTNGTRQMGQGSHCQRVAHRVVGVLPGRALLPGGQVARDLVQLRWQRPPLWHRKSPLQYPKSCECRRQRPHSKLQSHRMSSNTATHTHRVKQ